MLNPDFRDMLSAFAAERVEYLVVGAYAMASHGYVRATGDLDLWVRPERDNAARVLRALSAFGAPTAGLSEVDFEDADAVLQIGVAPRRIDVLTSIDGVTFGEAWEARREVEIDGVHVPVIGRVHLIRNKEATGRPKDRLDVERLRDAADSDWE